jgi:hypothetical protein
MRRLGLDLPIGSFDETLVIQAINRKSQIQFLTTLLTVNAIIHVGNSIQTALSGGSSQSNKGADNLQKMVDSLKSMLVPEDSLETESKVQKALRILEEETAKGPLKVRPMVENKKTKGRITRRRSE